MFFPYSERFKFHIHTKQEVKLQCSVLYIIIHFDVIYIMEVRNRKWKKVMNKKPNPLSGGGFSCKIESRISVIFVYLAIRCLYPSFDHFILSNTSTSTNTSAIVQ
jgi:hypothetical protein